MIANFVIAHYRPMIHQITRPHPSLQLFVKEYLIVHFDFKGYAQIPAKIFPPRPDTSIIFYPSQTFKKINTLINKQIDMPNSVVQGQQLTNWHHHYQQQFTCVKIVFQPGGLYHLLGKLPMTDLLDQAVDAQMVLGREVNEILQRLMDSQQYPEMIRVIEDYLMKKYHKIKLTVEPIDKIGSLFTQPNAYQSLDFLAHESCLSIRQFERKFKDRVGISPKLFTRLVRFNYAFGMKDENPTQDWLTIALNCGYTDYQHMVKDFKQFAGLTPTLLMKENDTSPDKLLGMNKVVVF